MNDNYDTRLTSNRFGPIAKGGAPATEEEMDVDCEEVADVPAAPSTDEKEKRADMPMPKSSPSPFIPGSIVREEGAPSGSAQASESPE